MIQVSRKDPKEPSESVLRRFTRKVQQSGVLAEVKMIQYFEKPLSKRERRRKAIVRRARKADKMTALKMGKKQ
ncbi:30S ribosomal protein S21 [Candidatus Saccharibacteria bacterium]|jgi:ribosomal protein S21|nr:MAG: 30S ribosomal protein S21 [Candidatus Saccharibacteria bacterium]